MRLLLVRNLAQSGTGGAGGSGGTSGGGGSGAAGTAGYNNPQGFSVPDFAWDMFQRHRLP